MPNRTQIVCLREGKEGAGVDGVFINKLLKSLKPAWIRPWKGSNVVRIIACEGRSQLITAMPGQLRICLEMGSDTTLMVWADLDHDMATGDQLKEKFWASAKDGGITREQFEQVVFVFAKDRLENWIEFLLEGHTDEFMEGPRQKNTALVADAARRLADECRSRVADLEFPPSLTWSCRNWHALEARMKR